MKGRTNSLTLFKHHLRPLEAVRGCLRSIWIPLFKGGIAVKVPLNKGDLGGSRASCYRILDLFKHPVSDVHELERVRSA